MSYVAVCWPRGAAAPGESSNATTLSRCTTLRIKKNASASNRIHYCSFPSNRMRLRMCVKLFQYLLFLRLCCLPVIIIIICHWLFTLPKKIGYAQRIEEVQHLKVILRVWLEQLDRRKYWINTASWQQRGNRKWWLPDRKLCHMCLVGRAVYIR